MFSQSWGNNGLNPIGGSHWLRQDIEIPQSWNGKEATLRLGCIVDADSVYVNGVFVGTTGYQYPPPYIPDTCRCIEIREKQCDRPNRQQRRTTEVSYRKKPYKIICGNEEVNLKQKWKYRLGAPMPPAPEMMFFFGTNRYAYTTP